MSNSETIPLSTLRYENCCFWKMNLQDDTKYGPCSEHDRFNQFGGKFFYDELKSSDEIKNDLIKQFKFSSMDIEISELELICNRAKTKVDIIEEYGPLMCYKHRSAFGLLWKPPKTCGFLEAQCKIKNLRTASVALTMEIWKNFGMQSFPLGTGLCPKHRLKKNWTVSEPVAQNEESRKRDPDFAEGTSGSFLVSEDSMERNREFSFVTAPSLFGVAPPMFQARKNIEDTSNRAKSRS